MMPRMLCALRLLLFPLLFAVHPQGYLWCASGPGGVPKTLPAVLAKPWATVAAALHMPPVLVYATYNLMNWCRLDHTQPVELGNLAVRHVSSIVRGVPLMCVV